MKIFCVTGLPGNHLQAVADLLASAGIARPAASSPNSLDFHSWHQRVLEASGDEGPVTQAAPAPGKFWEQVASNLFLENLQSPLWGWVEPGSVWLLDFWQQFEPNLHFVLVYTSPQRALATALASGMDGDNVGKLMDEWQAYHREMLRFHNRNARRTLLVNADECLASPEALIAACAGKWNLKIELPAAAAVTPEPAEPLAMYLVEQLRRTQPQVQALQNEIEASLHSLLSEAHIAHGETSVDAAVLDYRALRSSANQAVVLARQYDALTVELEQLGTEISARTARELEHHARIEALEQSCRTSTAELESIAAQRAALSQKAAELEAELKRREASDVAKASEVAALKDEASDLRAENSLLIVQLHQVQEELEQLFLKNKELSAVKASKRGLIDKLESELKQQSTVVDGLRKELASKTAELQKKLLEATAAHEKDVAGIKARHLVELKNAANSAAVAATNQELAAAKQRLAELESANRASLEKLAAKKARLDKTNLDLEHVTASFNASKKEVDSLRTELAKKKTQLESAQQSIDAARKNLDTRSNELEQSVRAGNEAKEENDLLLVQLHQVQEELENYFLKHKDATQQNRALSDRWERMLKRNPGYCDFETLVATKADGDARRIQWQLSGLNAAGRSFPGMQFETAIVNGVAELVFARENATKNNSGLYRWPAEFAGQNRLHIGASNDALLPASLSSSDAEFIRALCKLLITELAPAAQGSAELAALDPIERTQTQEALEALLAHIDDMPATLRFDQLSLRREQVNPDYEHVWLTIDNMALGAQRWNQFEFRLSCANVRPGKFGTHPKLEFPAGAGEAPFEKWFDEAYDDFGAKLELRFALPDAMDLAVWNALSPNDHVFLKQLAGAMPTMLRQLEQSGVALRRDFADWQALAANTLRILNERAPHVEAAIQAPEPAQPAPVQVALSKKTRARSPERVLK